MSPMNKTMKRWISAAQTTCTLSSEGKTFTTTLSLVWVMSGLSCSLHDTWFICSLCFLQFLMCVREKEAVKPKTWNLNSRIRIGDSAHKILQNPSCLSSLTFSDYTNSCVMSVCAMTAQIKFYFVFSFCIFPRNVWFSLFEQAQHNHNFGFSEVRKFSKYYKYTKSLSDSLCVHLFVFVFCSLHI